MPLCPAASAYKAIRQLNTAQSLVADIDTTRWSAFTSQNELIDGLYLARISQAASTNSACDWVISTVASKIGAGLPGSAAVMTRLACWGS